MSHYTFTFIPQVYRWLVSEQLLPNTGQANEKQLVVLPPDNNKTLENGWVVANAIRMMLAKSGQQPSSHLEAIVNEETKAVKSANWNFIWLCFDELRMQFDQRIRDLILQGQNALIPQILKQLYERDQNKDEKAMKNLLINQKPLPAGNDSKAKTQSKTNTLDVKRINLQKDPAESESSLQFLILLLAHSFSMSVEEILGLFTNQNKYLAHLLVKGINENFEGVILFYTLLLKNKNKFKQYLEGDPKDAESLLYAVKPGLISKSVKVAELSLELFKKLPLIYNWFISEHGRGSSTLALGVKRHPYLANQYTEVLLQIIRNEEEDFFMNHFQPSFRDPAQMVQICTYMMPGIAGSFMKSQLMQKGVFDEWASLALSLMEDNLSCKIISFKFFGTLLGHLAEVADNNEDYISGIRKGWRQYNMVEYVLLMQQLLLMIEQLASQKRPMARFVYQILIQVMQAIFDNLQKRQYLVSGFTTLISRFPKIPTQYLIGTYKEGTLTNADYQLILTSLENAPDLSSAISITQIILKLFNNNAVLNYFLGPLIFQVCKRSVQDESGRKFVIKVLRQCLNHYVQIQGSKNAPEVAKKQPMYFVQKGNEKYKVEEQEQFLVADKSSKNIFLLIQRILSLLQSLKSEPLNILIKQELMEANAILKKNHYKANNKMISNILHKKFGVSRQQEEQFNDDYRVKKSLAYMEQSMAKKRMTSSASAVPMTNSRFACPQHLRKDFDQVIEKRRKQEEQRRLQEEKRQRDDALKRIMVKKQLQKTNLLRGFGQQAELKEEGFWSKLIKDRGQLQLYPQQLMEARDIQYIDNLFKKYHKVMRNIFFKYTSSKYTTRSNVNFQDNKERNETLTTVEIIQFLKDYKFFFLTSKDQIQSLVRDISVKLLNKRQTNELDFFGFQQFVIQFCAIIYTKTHTINANTNKGIQTIKKNFSHLSHLQLVQQWFNYLKLVFIEKCQKTSLFDEPQAAYFNQAEVVKQFARKLEEEPGFILPQGYKKVTEKTLKLTAKMSDKFTKINQSYQDVFEVLDQILFESDLRIHLIEPLVEKQTKIRVKPHTFVNIKAKLLQDTSTKARAFSSIIDKKPAIPPVKLLQRKVLSFGMKLGLSYVSYKDKLLGQQVAYILDDMLTAVENGRSTIEKQKVINDIVKRRQQLHEKERFSEIEKQKKRLERKNELQKLKKQYTQKKQKQQQDTKEQRQRKKQKKLSRQKKIQEDKEQYLAEQKKKLEQKKKQEQEEKQKKKEEGKKKRQEKKKKQTQFKTFNEKQLQKFKKQFDGQAEKKKKQIQKQEEQNKRKQQLVKKLRSKIHQSDKKAIQTKLRMLQEISQLYNSDSIRRVYSDFQPSIRAIFDFLLKSSFHPITLKKNNYEIIFQTWHYFGLVFQLSPLIIHSNEMTKIFRHFTKDKQNHKDYTIGLTYQEFKQAILRIAIKHKSIFNKLSQKIKENMTSGQIDAVVQKDIEEKEKNEFQEPKQINVKNLVKQEDINKKITDHYGDISKVNDKTLKALIYYLKVPKDKQGQEKRFRQVIASKISYSVSNIQQLRQKLNDQYSLAPPPQKSKKKMEANQSMMSVSPEPKQQSPEP